MNILFIAAFAALCAGVFLLLGIDPVAFVDEMKNVLQNLNSNRKLTMKQKIERSMKRKEPRGIRKILIEARAILVMTHRTDRLPVYTLTSVVLFIIGMIAGPLTGNYFLMPVLAVGMSLFPWLYIIASATKFKRQLNDELETALSMITTSYLRTDNFLVSVRENIGYLNYPVKEVFEKLSVQSSLISSDLAALLEEMKNNFDNAVFKDWVDQVILCQNNRTLKSTLQPIVGRLSNVREVTGDMDNLMYAPLKEYIQMAAITVMIFPLTYFMSHEWFYTLMFTTTGQIIVAATILVIIVSLIAVVRSTRPVEYKR